MRSAVVLMSFLLVGSLAACRNENRTATTTSATSTTSDLTTDTATATHPASPGGSAIVPSTASGTTVIVTLTDGHLVVANPDQIPPGPAIITVANDGPGVHNLYISGEGIDRGPAQESLPAHSTTSFDVIFKPGTYTLYCPILNHRQNGESLTLVIKPPAAPAPSSTVVPGTTGTGTTGTTST
jgi:hypothetical protein